MQDYSSRIVEIPGVKVLCVKMDHIYDEGFAIGIDGSFYSRRKAVRVRGGERNRIRNTISVLDDHWRKVSPIKLSRGAGYFVVGIRTNNKGVQRYIHRIVLEGFVGLCPRGKECRHLDGNPANNYLENLSWNTHKENEADKNLHGTHTRGIRNGQAKLTELQVTALRNIYSTGKYSQEKLGKMFGICQTAVSQIIRRKAYKEL